MTSNKDDDSRFEESVGEMDEKACAGDEVLAEIPGFSQLYASLRFCVKFCAENPVGTNENAFDEDVVVADDRTCAEIRACAGLND